MSTGKTGILLVDDEAGDIHLMQNALETGGQYAIFTAADYDQAIQVFTDHSKQIDLCLLDVTLPDKNGVELAKQLLVLKPDLRILFVSGHVGASVIRFYGINVADEHFLQKPFDGGTLLERVRRAMESQEPLQRTLSASETEDQE